KLLTKQLFICSIILFSLFSKKGIAQDSTYTPVSNLGIGLGMDYGGLGVRMSFLTAHFLAVFFAVGTNFAGPGLNGGISFRIPTGNPNPYVSFMYGYNAVVIVEDAPSMNKVFYGPSISGGVEIHVGKRKA